MFMPPCPCYFSIIIRRNLKGSIPYAAIANRPYKPKDGHKNAVPLVLVGMRLFMFTEVDTRGAVVAHPRYICVP
jgi:hypothetical protein